MRLAHGYVAATEVTGRIPPPSGIPVTVITQGAADLPAGEQGPRRWREGHLALAAATGGRMIYADGAGLAKKAGGEMAAARLISPSWRCEGVWALHMERMWSSWGGSSARP
ncbi:hypothetical protein [Sphingomonas sp.]|uniref:hypothetical protein n=1 Tax=Sphingomonas sp. TaxID=28214 RepID=UPI002ED9E6B5